MQQSRLGQTVPVLWPAMGNAVPNLLGRPCGRARKTTSGVGIAGHVWAGDNATDVGCALQGLLLFKTPTVRSAEQAFSGEMNTKPSPDATGRHACMHAHTSYNRLV